LLSGVPCVVYFAFFLDTGGVQMLAEFATSMKRAYMDGFGKEWSQTQPSTRSYFKSSLFGSWLQTNAIFCRGELA